MEEEQQQKRIFHSAKLEKYVGNISLGFNKAHDKLVTLKSS